MKNPPTLSVCARGSLSFSSTLYPLSISSFRGSLFFPFYIMFLYPLYVFYLLRFHSVARYVFFRNLRFGATLSKLHCQSYVVRATLLSVIIEGKPLPALPQLPPMGGGGRGGGQEKGIMGGIAKNHTDEQFPRSSQNAVLFLMHFGRALSSLLAPVRFQ